MQNLRSLSDQSILETTVSLVKLERETTNQILHFLAEVERRRIFAKEGFSSLFDFCTKRLGYSEGGAVRRIQSMRLLKGLNQEGAKVIEQKIEEGKLSLSVVAQAASFIQKEAKITPQEWNSIKKEELLLSLEGASARETERRLLSLSSQEKPQCIEKIRPIDADLTELRVVVNAETLALIEKVKDLMSHSQPNPSLGEVIKYMAQITVQKLDPARPVKSAKQPEKRTTHPAEPKDAKMASNSPENSPTLAVIKRKPVQKALKRAVWQRDQGKCQFQNPVTGKKCHSTRFLELDHLIPVVRGGVNTLENLSLRCRNHNQLHALLDFGSTHMSKWVPSIR